MLRSFTFLSLLVFVISQDEDLKLMNEGSNIKSNEQKFVEANNAFALHLYKHLSSSDGNIFFCSACLTSSLSLLLDASIKDTAVDLKKSLQFKKTKLEMEGIRQQCSELTKKMKSVKCLDQYTNALFVQSGYELNSDFVTNAQDYYNTEIFETDFAGNQKQAVWEINEWIKTRTLGRIRRLFERTSTKNSMLLVNTVSFKTKLSGIFDKDAMLKEKFYNHGFYDEEVDTFVMEKRNAVQKIATSYDFRALELPCGSSINSTLKLWIFLPHKVGSLPDVEFGLSAETFEQLQGSFKDTIINITIPRIRIDFSRDISKELQRMGMKRAFDEDAEFDTLSPNQGLHLTQVLQRAVIDLNENLMESFYSDYYNSSSTSETDFRENMSSYVQPFQANHPFMFFIIDVRNGLILYIGRVYEF